MISGYTEVLGAMVALATSLLSENPLYEFTPNELNVQETFCLAQNVWFEARSTSFEDQVMVGLTTLNRVRDSRYSQTICEVARQGVKNNDGSMKLNACQFSWFCDGKPDVIEINNPIDMRVWNEIVRMSILLQVGFIEDTSEGATHYHAHYVKPYWAKEKIILASTDGHIFYRSRNGERYLQTADPYIEGIRALRRENMHTMIEVYQVMSEILPDTPEEIINISYNEGPF